MHSNKHRGRRRGRSPLHEEDPIDSFELLNVAGQERADRRARQLCRQVFKTLVLVFPGELHEPVLESTWLESVEPAPDASRLVVTVRPLGPRWSAEPAQVLEALERVRGYLRAQVAAAICRKRAPELVFRLLGPGEAQP